MKPVSKTGLRASRPEQRRPSVLLQMMLSPKWSDELARQA